jgi:hypothetical protein
MVTLVERMLELNKQKHSGEHRAVAAIYDRRVVEHSSTLQLERDITVTDAEIDNLVYELYGITGEERKIIEGT